MTTRLLPLVVLLACGGPDASAVSPDLDRDDAETGTQPLPAMTWWPLGEGNTWRLESKSAARTIRVEQFDGTRALVSGLLRDDAWFAEASDRSLAVHWYDGKAWQAWARFGLSRTPWVPMAGRCTNSLAARGASAATVETPLSAFSDTVTLVFINEGPESCPQGDVSQITFAPRVGPIALKTTRGEVFALTRGTLDGAPIVGAGVQGALTLTASTWRQMAGAPVVLTGVFALTNVGAAPRTFRFGSSCVIELEVSTLAGTVVKRATQEQACAAGTVELTLAGGESRELPVQVTLADSQGLPLVGQFTVVARLNVPRGQSTPTASAPVTVEAAP